jgi:hypothetical protein
LANIGDNPPEPPSPDVPTDRFDVRASAGPQLIQQRFALFHRKEPEEPAEKDPPSAKFSSFGFL